MPLPRCPTSRPARVRSAAALRRQFSVAAQTSTGSAREGLQQPGTSCATGQAWPVRPPTPGASTSKSNASSQSTNTSSLQSTNTSSQSSNASSHSANASSLQSTNTSSQSSNASSKCTNEHRHLQSSASSLGSNVSAKPPSNYRHHQRNHRVLLDVDADVGRACTEFHAAFLRNAGCEIDRLLPSLYAQRHLLRPGEAATILNHLARLRLTFHNVENSSSCSGEQFMPVTLDEAHVS